MIQFNLLPDVKLEYIKARRTKQTVIMVSIIVASASLVIFVLLFSVVNFVQKTHLSNVQRDIDTSKKQLDKQPELAKILTIQNQLNSLPALHKSKPVASRVFSYVQQVTPQNASVSSLTVNFKDKTIKIEGAADSLATVNTFTDTLKFTNFTIVSASDTTPSAADKKVTPAFSSVVLADFATGGKTVKDKKKAATYSITLKYDAAIFSGDKDVKLQVSSKITTRSETEKPATIFQANPVIPGATQEIE